MNWVQLAIAAFAGGGLVGLVAFLKAHFGNPKPPAPPAK